MAKRTGLASAVKKPATPDEWVKEQPKRDLDKIVKLVVEIPEDLHTSIKTRCAERRLKIKNVTEQLLQRWIDGEIQL
jgi:hypothetical protein